MPSRTLDYDSRDALRLRLRKATRPACFDDVHALQSSGPPQIAGLRPRVDAVVPAAVGFYGSRVMAGLAGLAAAEAWATGAHDAKAGVFERGDVQPFIPVLPA